MRKSYNLYKEITLVRKSKKGDALAFEELIFRNDEKITASILQLCKQNFHDAQDIKQTTFLKCWKYIGKFKGDSAFSTWAIRIAKNSFFDLYRKRKNKPEYSWEALTQTEKDDGFQQKPQIVELTGATSGKVVTEPLEQEEFRKKVKKTIDSLPKNHKKVEFHLIHYHQNQPLIFFSFPHKVCIPAHRRTSLIYWEGVESSKLSKFVQIAAELHPPF